jgi:hypothetical protein
LTAGGGVAEFTLLSSILTKERGSEAEVAAACSFVTRHMVGGLQQGAFKREH